MWIAAISVAARSSSATAPACGTAPANTHSAKERADLLAAAHPRLDIEAPLERQLVGLHRDGESAQTAAGLGWNFDRVAADRAGQQIPAAQLGGKTAGRARRDRHDAQVLVAGVGDRDAQ